jgi:hypothetical protein
MRFLAQRLAEQGQLRAGVSVGDAAHVLWVLAGFESFDALYTDRSLPVDEVGRLLPNASCAADPLGGAIGPFDSRRTTAQGRYWR